MNVDSTIILERPKLKDFRSAIRESLAAALQLPEVVAIKFKTAERVGPVGEGRSCEAQAVVLLERRTGLASPPCGETLFATFYLAAVSLAGACFAAGVCRRLRFSPAEYGRDSKRGVKLVPFNADYAARLAGWKSEQRTPCFRAVRLNPFEIQAWIQLGFDAEFRRA